MVLPRKIHLAFALAVVALVAAVEACSAAEDGREQLGRITAAVVSPSGNNATIATTTQAETTVTYVSGVGGSGGGQQGSWIVAANGSGQTTQFSWGYSTDGTAANWNVPGGGTSFQQISSGTAFGSPPTNSPQDNTDSFQGIRGDSSLSAITDSTWNNSGKRVVFVNTASTTKHPNGVPDIIIALSEDGGRTWGNVQWVDTAGTITNSGGDMPFVASNPESPYDTWVSWADVGGQKGYIRQVKYGAPPSSQFLPPGSPIAVPKLGSDGYVNRFNLAFGKVSTAHCGSGSEAIFVVYTNDISGCARDGTRGSPGSTINWNMAIYDTGNSSWYGPWNIDSDSNYYMCAGFPLNQASTNTVDPHIAVDPESDTWAIIHTKTTSYGIKTVVNYGGIACGGPSGGGTWTDPVPQSDPAHLPDGGLPIQDDWLPGIAVQRYGGVLRFTWFWMGMIDDPYYNNRVGIYSAFSENSFGTISTPVRNTTTVNGQYTWPLPINVAQQDYETMGSSWTTGQFLSVWSGDMRANASPTLNANGGFESGDFTSWTATGAHEAVITGAAHSGTYGAILGNTTPTNGDSTISQTFTAASTAMQVSFWYKMTCPDTITYDWATATLTDNTAGGTTTILPKICTTNSWTQVASPLVAGHSYTINLTSHDDNYGADPSYTYFDDVGTLGEGSTAMMSELLK